MEVIGDKAPELSVETENMQIMDPTNDKAPELPVETENIRKNSTSITDFKSLQPSEVHLESVSPKSSSMPHKPAMDLHPDVKTESNMKRVDSYSKFGVMETIPLEIQPVEATSAITPAPEAYDKPENLTLQIRSLSLNENILQSEPQKMASHKRPQSATECETNMLSKYFSLDSTKTTSNPEGIEFFNALAKSPNATEALMEDSSKTAQMEERSLKDVQNPGEALDKNIILDNNSLADENKEPQPQLLLKFFAEDKSGSDKDGKLFFDKIAETSPAGTALMEIKEPVLNVNPTEDPILSSPSSNSEIEEAWIPSEKTRQALVTCITSGVFVLDKSQQTMPGVIIDEELEDPVKSLLLECNSLQAQHRKVLTVNDVPEDENGLKQLIEAECYHAAVNLTKRLLKSCGQGLGDDGKPSKNTPLTLRLWHTRLALLVKLRKFSLAEVESAAFGDLDRPDLFYEFYPDLYERKRGSMVPFSLRLLLAELPQYQGNHQIAMDNMYCILNTIKKIIKNLKTGCTEDGSMIKLSESRQKASIEIWGKREQRVLYSILNSVLAQKDYALAVSLTKLLIEKSKSNIPELHSALGRIYLQLGDVKYAQNCFTMAATLSEDPQFQVEDFINKALLAIALNNSEEAYKFYQQAYSLCPKNAMLANNMAVCLLYMGRLKESLTLLEKTIYSNPMSCLHDGLLFNTCTLYELESSRCTQKKIAMLELVSKYAGDAFNVSCLKIQPVSKA